MKKWIVTFIICIGALCTAVTNAVSVQDQSKKKADVEITRKIRSEITKTRNLSTYAKNVKIIVRESDVTLIGPVTSLAEKAKLVEIATTIAPNHRLHNELVVTR